MTLFFVTSDTINSGGGSGITLATGDDVVVQTGAFLASTTQYGINGLGNGHRVTVLGTVSGSSGYSGISLGDSSSSSNQNLYIGATGTVIGTDFVAVYLYGSSTVFNNHGAVTGTDSAVVLLGDGGIAQVFNSGTIDGDYNGLFLVGSNAATVVNTGVIHGRVNALQALEGAVTLTNTGLMLGDVQFGSGADSYDGRGGQVLGQIFGNLGNDSFIMGANAESLDGGGGVDTVNYRHTGGVTLALDGSFDTGGAALGDVVAGVENVLGSATGADRIAGNTAANLLRGYGGGDALSGAAGADSLVGGQGIDTLHGGLGNDQFWFETLAQAGDIIQDFSAAAGNNDLIRISAAGFGAGLVGGAFLSAAQFQSRADNLAQDSNDRFIFRSTDATLWFDANGSAAGGLTLVADLQAGAVVSAADIWLA